MTTQLTNETINPGAILEVNDARFVQRLFATKHVREVAFREMVKKTHGHLFKYVLCYVSDSGKAQEIVQRIYKSAFLTLDKYNCDIKLSTWLYIMANSILFDTLSDSAWQPDTRIIDNDLKQVFTGTDSSRDSLLKKLIPKLAESLPASLKEVYFIKDIGGISLSETASILGLSLETVRIRLDWARHHIVQQLQKKLALT